MNSFIIYKYEDPDEKFKYRDKTQTFDTLLPDRKNYVSTFKTISRDQRQYIEDFVRLLCL
jgi:hypothetical protein